MKSSIKIDFVDRGTGVGIEPVIRVEIIQSDDPRDTLISHLFQSVADGEFLQFHYSNTLIENDLIGVPAYHKQVLIFKPEVEKLLQKDIDAG